MGAVIIVDLLQSITPPLHKHAPNYLGRQTALYDAVKHCPSFFHYKYREV